MKIIEKKYNILFIINKKIKDLYIKIQLNYTRIY